MPTLRPAPLSAFDFDRDNGQSAIIAPGGSSIFAAGANTALTAGRAYLGRFVPSRPMTITSISFVVTAAAGADDACDVGIYDSAYERVVSSGATSGKLNATTGVKNITVSATTLTPGTVYYAAFSVVTPFGGSAASVRTTSVPADLVDLIGTSAGLREQAFQSSAHPLGTTITPGGGTGTVPILALKEG